MNSNVKKTLLAAAVASTLGATAVPAQAVILNFSYEGLFTMLTSGGAGVANTVTGYWYNSNGKYYGNGNRTQITGTMTFDTDTMSGSGTVTPFLFFGTELKHFAKATNITFQAIGDGMGGPGTLVLGNMGFDWSGNNGIPVSIVMDAAGMFGALQFGTVAPTLTIVGSTDYIAVRGTMYSLGDHTNTFVAGTTPASEHTYDVTNKTGTTHSQHIGLAPISTTTWNTTSAFCTPGGGATGPCMGFNPSGTLPLIADSIGGSPMIAGPFEGFNANFDITAMHLDSVAIPVPAAVWLFGSGLLGVVGIARRKNKKSA